MKTANDIRILVACESSGVVRQAFTSRGFDATSCDLLPTEIPGKHYHGDIIDIIHEEWDLIVAHPPCTYLCNSGVRWLKDNNERMIDMCYGAKFFNIFLYHPHVKHIAIENPIPHKYALQIIGRKYDQLIQPWQFGHGETKATCLWLKNLPKLVPTNIVEGREQRIWKMPPGADRWKERSRTFQGIADAMAEQWGDYLLSK